MKYDELPAIVKYWLSLGMTMEEIEQKVVDVLEKSFKEAGEKAVMKDLYGKDK